MWPVVTICDQNVTIPGHTFFRIKKWRQKSKIFQFFRKFVIPIKKKCDQNFRMYTDVCVRMHACVHVRTYACMNCIHACAYACVRTSVYIRKFWSHFFFMETRLFQFFLFFFQFYLHFFIRKILQPKMVTNGHKWSHFFKCFRFISMNFRKNVTIFFLYFLEINFIFLILFFFQKKFMETNIFLYNIYGINYYIYHI